MGVDSSIPLGGLFPERKCQNDMTVDDMVAFDSEHGQESNHSSFDMLHDQEASPGVSLVREHVERGFGIVLEDKEAAEAWLGCGVFPAPLGIFPRRSPMAAPHIG